MNSLLCVYEGHHSISSLVINKQLFSVELNIYFKSSLICSVSETFHFDTDPDPRIRFVEK